MNLQRTNLYLFAVILLLSACVEQEQAVTPTPIAAPAVKIETIVPSNSDPALFGALPKSEINPLAGKIQEAIFIKVMDEFIASGNILEYQIVASEVFPSSDDTLIAEIIYNVRTTDDSWLVDGGIRTSDNWIMDKCNRFDFVNTETEFQLRNRRTCN